MSDKYNEGLTMDEELARLEYEKNRAVLHSESQSAIALMDAEGAAFLSDLENEKEKFLESLGISSVGDKESEIISNLVNKSVGKVEIKKIIKYIVISLAVAVSASVVLSGIVAFFKNQAKIDDVSASYADYDQLIRFNTGTGEYDYSYRVIGEAIANSIIEKTEHNQNLDVNRELIVAIGTMDLPSEEFRGYNAFKGDGNNPSYMPQGWAENIYDEIREKLNAAGIIQLPATLKEYMVANGFAKGIFKFNDITGEISYIPLKEGVELSVDDIFKNLEEFAKASAVNNVGLDDAQQIGGRK